MKVKEEDYLLDGFDLGRVVEYKGSNYYSVSSVLFWASASGKALARKQRNQYREERRS